MTAIAYIRVSSDKQNCANQKTEIESFCKSHHLTIDRWVTEVVSSRKKLNERKLGFVLKKMKKGDVLIASEISRLGRNLLEVMSILQNCLEKGCQIITIKENYHLGSDIQSKVLAFAFGLSAEIERQLISQRTKECLLRLKKEGRHLGRPYGFSYKKLDKHSDEIKKMLAQKVPKTQIAKLLGCSWTTLHRYVKDVF